jgi:hypothetical protein
LSGLGGPTSSYATSGIALRVSGALKPHHHDKVRIALVGLKMIKLGKNIGHKVCVTTHSEIIRNSGRNLLRNFISYDTNCTENYVSNN